MAQVPLNHFARASRTLTTTFTQVYSAPVDTAAIMLTILATNTTSNTETVTMGISGNGDPAANISTRPYFDIIKTFSIPANDVVNLAVGKLVLENFDAVFCFASSNSAININCSILETLNTAL